MGSLSRWGLLVLCCTFSLVLGCADSSSGPSGKPTKGKVTFKGEPVTEGKIFFSNTSLGTGGSGEINPDGTFATTSPLISGTYKVFIQPPEVDAPSDGKTMPRKMLKEMENIPKIYHTESTSPLTADIGDGKLLEFELGEE
jgi:hypothetical protein